MAVRSVNWEQAGLVDSWKGIAEVVRFDWAAQLENTTASWFPQGRQDLGRELLERVSAAHAERPIDVFFSYLSGYWVDREVIEGIRAMGILTVNFDFDDTRKFWNKRKQGVYTGSAELAPAFDVCVTAQSSSNVGKYVAIGANPLFLPAGGNEDVFAIEQQPVRDIPVSFVGQNYGARTDMIAFVEDQGIEVYKRGLGWPAGAASQQEMLDIYARSVVTLGFGYIGKTQLLGLKGRDFEVPMTGCAYLTTWNPELAGYFEPDREILFYRDREDLLLKLRSCLENPEWAIDIGRRGRERALAQHTWGARWRTLLGVLG